MADEMDYMEQAKELADSYRLLVHRRDMLRQQYEDSRSWFYTKDEIIYKLSQGAHEESERVQTSGTSNPVERTVLNCDKVLASMNREVQTQRTEQFLEPYYKVCEDIELFEVGLRSLRGCTRIVAEQLFVDGRKQSEITGKMRFKEIVKQNKTIRKTGKILKIYREFLGDAHGFSSSYIESAEEKENYKYSILLLVHSLEKGMCMPMPRPFGGGRLKNLSHV